MSFEESEESKLRLTEKRRSGGMGKPETMYLKMRAWCSSSCHWLAVKGNLFLPLIFQREYSRRESKATFRFQRGQGRERIEKTRVFRREFG